MQTDFKRIVAVLCEIPEAPTREATADERTALVKEGQDLAWRVMNQRWRITLSPFNAQEGAALDALQKLFASWEVKARAAGVDVEASLAGYELKNLRPFIAPAEPERPKDWAWGFVVRDNTPSTPRPQTKRLYGVGTTGND